MFSNRISTPRNRRSYGIFFPPPLDFWLSITFHPPIESRPASFGVSTTHTRTRARAVSVDRTCSSHGSHARIHVHTGKWSWWRSPVSASTSNKLRATLGVRGIARVNDASLVPSRWKEGREKGEGEITRAWLGWFLLRTFRDSTRQLSGTGNAYPVVQPRNQFSTFYHLNMKENLVSVFHSKFRQSLGINSFSR